MTAAQTWIQVKDTRFIISPKSITCEEPQTRFPANEHTRAQYLQDFVILTRQVMVVTINVLLR